MLAVGTFPPNGKVSGPPRDYQITVKAFNKGGPISTAHVVFHVTG